MQGGNLAGGEIAFADAFEVSCSPAQAFALLDDPRRAAEWLCCVRIEQLSAGPRAVGSRMRYTFDHAGSRGDMEGAVTAYERDRHLAMSYQSASFEVAIDIRLEPVSGGTRIAETVSLRPRSLLGRITAPLVRSLTRRHAACGVETLKRTLAQAGH